MIIATLKKMDEVEVCAPARYCIKHDMRDWLYFFDRTHSNTIIYAAAEAHNQYFVDLEIARGVITDFSAAMVYSIKTEDVKWITYFKTGLPGIKGGTNYQNCMIEAMRINNKELVELIWEWSDGDISEAIIIQELGCCSDPVNMLSILDELGIDFDYELDDDEPSIDFSNWDHKTQITMINKLIDLGYEDYQGFRVGVIKSGNMEGIRLIQNWLDTNYDSVFNLAVQYNQMDIVNFALEHGNFTQEQLNLMLVQNTGRTDLNPKVLELLIAKGAKIFVPRPGSRRIRLPPT